MDYIPPPPPQTPVPPVAYAPSIPLPPPPASCVPKEKFFALVIIIVVLKVLACLAAVGAVIAGISTASDFFSSRYGGVLATACVFGGIVGGFILWTIFRAAAELIRVMLDIEKNTRAR